MSSRPIQPSDFSFRSPAMLSASFLAVITYIFSATFQFTYDDLLHIVHNPQVTRVAPGLDTFYSSFLTPTRPGDLYRPITLITLQVNFFLSGLAPGWYHLFNIMLFAVCSALIYLLFHRSLKSSSLALVAALVFVAHPVHVETVANVMGRAELLSACFGLLACLLLSSSLRLMSVFLCSLCVLLASLSKESGLVFAVLAPLFAAHITDAQGIRERLGVLWLPLVLCGVAGIASIALRYSILGPKFLLVSDGTIYPENPLFHLSFVDRLIPGLRLLGDYLILILWPQHLSADYSQMPAEFFSTTYSIVGAISFFVLALFIALIWYLRAHRWSMWGIWYFVGFLLTCNVFTPIGTLKAERLLFTPSIGAIALLVAAAHQFATKMKLSDRFVQGVVLLVLCSLFLRTTSRIPVWRDNRVLFIQTLSDAPSSPKAHYNLASIEFARGQLATAEGLLKRAITLHPKHEISLRLLADIALKQGNPAKLEHYYRRLLSIRPNDQEVRSRLQQLEKIKSEALSN